MWQVFTTGEGNHQKSYDQAHTSSTASVQLLKNSTKGLCAFILQNWSEKRPEGWGTILPAKKCEGIAHAKHAGDEEGIPFS